MLWSAPAVLVALVAAPLAKAAGPYDGLLVAVPPQVNCLVLVDVQKAFASPLAQSERWASDISARFRSGIGFVPPDAGRLVISSQVNLSTMTRDSQVGLVTAQQPPSMRALAEREGGVASDLLGQTVCLSPRNVYFASPASGTLAAVYPADRQVTARWLRHATTAKTATLAPYLQAAADAAGKHTVTVAVDMTNAVDPVILRMSLANSPIFVRHKNVDMAGLSRQVAAIQGLTFTADVTDKVAGAVRLDFAFDPSPFRGVLRDLFLELLADQGAVIPAVEAWEEKYEGNSLTLSGPLSGPDLKRVLSLFAFPGATPEEHPGAAADRVSVAATRQYLGAVEAILADVRRTREDRGYEKTATWHEKAAAQIEQLNRRAVDPAAVGAAEAAATRLQAIAASLRGLPVDVENLQRQQYAYSFRAGGLFWGWSPFAPSFVQTNVPEIQKQIAKTVEADKEKRAGLWAQIDSGMATARKELGEKYKEKF